MAETAQSATGSSVWLRWLHRIGYVTTALVAAFGLFLGYLSLDLPRPDWSGEATKRPLEEMWSRHFRQSGNAVLRSLPGRDAMVTSGLRLVIMPSFSDWFGLAIYRDPSGASLGVLTRHQQAPWNPDASMSPVEIQRSTFRIPASEYGQFLSWFDRWVDKHGGEATRPCLDGAPIAFERIANGKVISGMGNCEAHYDALGQRALALVKRQLPAADLPADPRWHEWKEE